MDKDLKTSKLRVRAFRERVGNDHKRVESYISSEEKAEVDAIKRELGLSTDSAVAGLIRLGLSAYALSNNSPAKEPSVIGAQGLGSALPLNSVNASLTEPSAFVANAAPLAGASSQGTPVQPGPDTNLIRQFFQSRKERQQ